MRTAATLGLSRWFCVIFPAHAEPELASKRRRRQLLCAAESAVRQLHRRAASHERASSSACALTRWRAVRRVRRRAGAAADRSPSLRDERRRDVAPRGRLRRVRPASLSSRRRVSVLWRRRVSRAARRPYRHPLPAHRDRVATPGLSRRPAVRIRGRDCVQKNQHHHCGHQTIQHAIR